MSIGDAYRHPPLAPPHREGKNSGGGDEVGSEAGEEEHERDPPDQQDHPDDDPGVAHSSNPTVVKNHNALVSQTTVNPVNSRPPMVGRAHPGSP